MRRHALLVLLAGSPAVAQTPLPPSVAALSGANPPAATPGIAAPIEVRLPREEVFAPVDPRLFAARKLNGGWTVYQGTAAFAEFGQDADGAAETVRVLRELAPNDWARITPTLGYGLTNGRPAVNAGVLKTFTAIDLKGVRVEPVRGAWCLRDDVNIIQNFGVNRADAEQAAAVVRKYGFNRLGTIGREQAFAFLYAQPETPGAKPPTSEKDLAMARAIQEQSMKRTGIELPGVGYVGEKLALDLRKIEHRKEKADWVAASGGDVFARFGPNENAAREAAKLVRECRFTEVATYGTGGLTFFLTNGQPATNVPFFAQGRRFDPKSLKARELAGKWWVYDGGGQSVCSAATAEEADIAIRLIRAYGFDQLCQIGLSRSGLKFLAKAK